MEDRIHLQIVTAGGTKFDQMVRLVRIPLEGGDIGVLADHAPLMGAVTDGVVTCEFGKEESESIAVGIGVVNVVNNDVTLLVRSAERAEDIDVHRAEEAERRARERLAQHASDVDMTRAEASLHRAIARQKAAHTVKKK